MIMEFKRMTASTNIYITIMGLKYDSDTFLFNKLINVNFKCLYCIINKKAYDGFFNRAYYSNGNNLGSEGGASDNGFQLFLQNSKNGNFTMHLSHNYYFKAHLINGKMKINLFLDGMCVFVD